MDQDSAKLKSAIISSTGKSEQEIEKLIEAKKEKFSGLLTEAGATFMIAKELGINANTKIAIETKIALLKEGMNNIDIVARIKQIFPQKTFDKNGRKGKLQNVVLFDSSGQIRATLWNSDADKFSSNGFLQGECLKFSNCAISSYNGVLQLGLNYNSSIEKTQSDIPELESKLTSITDLDSTMNDVNVSVLIKKIFPAKNFETERGEGKVMNFIISQGVNEIRATAWNEQCDIIEEIGEGEKVKIESAYTKENRGEVELHLGHGARVLKDS
ncbi:MAG TPA: hypothetical protein VJG83_06570 [archaeon]|nr:hypothetical protein [archaeon]